jgi:hypothetical protein
MLRSKWGKLEEETSRRKRWPFWNKFDVGYLREKQE